MEVDETYIGGKDKNRALSKRGKTKIERAIVVGATDRSTNQVSAAMIRHADRATLTMFVSGHARHGATIYTDDHPAYRKLPYPHEAVTHSVSEYVRGQSHTNGIESFWALLKRSYHGSFHHFSKKHLQRNVNEFAAR